MNLAVIIPAYNHLAEVLTALNSLRALQSCDVLYHVQDDCSPDVKYPVCIPREVASVNRNPVNLGFAANCNRGALSVVEELNPDVLFFVNQDVYAVTEWSQNWDTALLDAFCDETVGIVGARLLFPNGTIQNAGGAFDQLAQPVHRCLGWTNPRAEACGTAAEVEWTTGAALAVRANLFMQLGGFDEGYRMYWEDADLCLRAKQAGARVWYAPACTLMHAVGSTGGSPHFAAGARRFKSKWVDTGKVTAGRMTPTQRFW